MVNSDIALCWNQFARDRNGILCGCGCLCGCRHLCGRKATWATQFQSAAIENNELASSLVNVLAVFDRVTNTVAPGTQSTELVGVPICTIAGITTILIGYLRVPGFHLRDPLASLEKVLQFGQT